MKYTIPAFFLALIFLAGCGPTAKVTTKTEYKDTLVIKSVHVIVVSDAQTQACMAYYQRYFVDSLKRYGVAAEGSFYCCVERKTNLKTLVDSLGQEYMANSQNLLAVVMTKTVTGYGTGSSRELQLLLYNTEKQEVTWRGKLAADFNWFVSDENYQKVAHAMTNSTLKTMKYETIITD